ncbi:hypothetical protein INT44_004819 [Umbelopsis vinacea]|uniref:Uncharacterized protein n=1 Tax=Umbelopsis vinacea TaxID=44442 RepID=A0A8H7UQE8_9FUNG|nr:hypothetical protein INT44_004819 [Umbelopsis vinacea]
MQPLTPSRRNTKDTHETTESPKKPLATITNKAVHKKTGRQSKTSSPVTTPKSRLSAPTAIYSPIGSPLSKRTLDVQHDLFKVYEDAINSPERGRNLPSQRRRSLSLSSDGILEHATSSLDSESRHNQVVQELEQQLEQQKRDNERLQKELDEEKSHRKALEDDHKLQDEFIRALERQLTDMKLTHKEKCDSLQREIEEYSELLEECRTLLELTQAESSSS